MSYLVLADDLTGALEIGVLARNAGWRSRVLLSGATLRHPDTEFPVVIVDTGSREAPADGARQAIRTLLSGLSDDPRTVVLKKTDSLLRGNIVVELAELCARLPRRQLVYVPAYPLMGRTVSGGRLHADGIPALPWDGNVLEMLRDLPVGYPVRAVSNHQALRESLLESAARQEARGAVPLLVCDGQHQAEVDAMAQILRKVAERVIVAGPAGIFRSYFPAPAVALPSLPLPRIVSGIAFVGSRHEVSLAQCEAAIRTGSVVHAFAVAEDFRHYERAWQAACSRKQWLLLQSVGESAAAPLMRFSPLMQLSLPSCDEDALPAALYLSGGSTADACLRAMGCDALEPLAELLPGVVLSEARVGDRALPVITKSGAFGDARTLVEVLAMLQGKS